MNKTVEATVKAGETYTYPTSLPLGTVVTVAEGDLPAGAGITWVDGDSRVFEAAGGVTLSADKREATFTLTDDLIYSLTLTNTVAPSPAPSATPSAPAPTPSATPSAPASTPSPAPQLAKTGTDAAGLGVMAGIVAIAGLSLVVAKRRNR